MESQLLRQVVEVDVSVLLSKERLNLFELFASHVDSVFVDGFLKLWSREHTFVVGVHLHQSSVDTFPVVG